MERLKELVDVINPKRINYVNIFSNHLNTDSKLMQLYQGISSSKIKDDESGIALLYPDDTEGRSKFSKLKYHFKKRIINTILLIEIKDGSGKKERRKAFFDCLRTFIIAYFLIMLYARTTGIHMLKQKLKVMQHYDFTFMVVESAKVLRQHYVGIVGHVSKAKEYNTLIKKYLHLYNVETEVEGYYYELMGYYVKNKASKHFLLDLANAYSKEIPTTPPDSASSSLVFKMAMIRIIASMSASKHIEAMRICEDAVRLLKNKPFLDYMAISAIYFQWITCALYLLDWNACERLVGEVMTYMDEGEFNWFKGMMVLTEVSFHKGEYDKAYQYYQRVVAQKSFKKLAPTFLEEWRVYQAYFHLLMVFGKVERQAALEKQGIKLQKFFNEVPLSFQDKEGMNVPIMIYGILVMIYKEQYDKVVNKSEALYKYANRYLKENGHERTNYFIKMLLYLCRNNCSYERMDDKIELYYQKLRQQRTIMDEGQQDLEIIPYEALWAMLTEHLNYVSVTLLANNQSSSSPSI